MVENYPMFYKEQSGDHYISFIFIIETGCAFNLCSESMQSILYCAMAKQDLKTNASYQHFKKNFFTYIWDTVTDLADIKVCHETLFQT